MFIVMVTFAFSDFKQCHGVYITIGLNMRIGIG